MQQWHNPYTLAVINRKGGNGKTTLTINLAGELALQGFNVGIVDADSQPGNASLFFQMPREDGLYLAMVGHQHGDQYLPVPLRELIRVVPPDGYLAPQLKIESGTDGEHLVEVPEYPIGNLYMLPSGPNTFQIPYFVPDIYRFGDIVQEFIRLCDLDIVLIDTAPTMSMLDGAVFDAADGFLYVTETEIAALAGLDEAVQQVERISARRQRTGRRPSQMIGIIPNKVRSLKEHTDNINLIGQAFPGLVGPMVRMLKSYSKSVKYGQTVRGLSPRGPEAFEILKVTQFVREAMQAWQSVR